MEWKTIESCKRDGQKLLLGAYAENGEWYEAVGRQADLTNIPCGFRKYVRPTHWMHLPQPPSKPEGK